MLENTDKPVSKSLRIGDHAPVFRARTTQGDISLDQYQGRWLVFFSHPADFTPVCTSEFIAFAHAAESFNKLNCALLGLSVDSLYSHIAWVRAIHEAFGTTIPFPVVEDPSMVVAQAYGMIDSTSQDSSAVRATYVIDPEGIIRAISWYPMNVGRSVAEILRVLAALQQTAANEALTPEGWQPGDEFLAPPAQAALAADSPPTWFCQTRNVT
ncbi:MAG: peroxiredoxin [Acidocella sp.]|jgi:peroxiredoxin (alkyl hydroperoxide reductase subunit C)|nr:peroxiredoxin [Acidocella sp.]